MRGRTNYSQEFNCRRVRCRWVPLSPVTEKSFTSQQVAEMRLQLSILRRMKWRQQFLSEIVPGESRSIPADRNSTPPMARQTTSPLSMSNRARNCGASKPATAHGESRLFPRKDGLGSRPLQRTDGWEAGHSFADYPPA